MEELPQLNILLSWSCSGKFGLFAHPASMNAWIRAQGKYCPRQEKCYPDLLPQFQHGNSFQHLHCSREPWSWLHLATGIERKENMLLGFAFSKCLVYIYMLKEQFSHCSRSPRDWVRLRRKVIINHTSVLQRAGLAVFLPTRTTHSSVFPFLVHEAERRCFNKAIPWHCQYGPGYSSHCVFEAKGAQGCFVALFIDIAFILLRHQF